MLVFVMKLNRLFVKHGCTIATSIVSSVLTALVMMSYITHLPFSCVDNARPYLVKKSDLQGHFDAKLVILIMSSSSSAQRRAAIRATWLSKEIAGIRAFFVLGSKGWSKEELTAAKAEQKEHGDMVLFYDFYDSYKMLTSKVLRSFTWVYLNVQAQFIMKTDDDSFLLLPQLLDLVSSWEKHVSLYAGFFDGRAHVKKHGPWKDSHYYLCDRYLPYALGGGYILSADLVAYLAENGHRLVKFLSEDASVGSWLAPLNITRFHDVRFDTEYISRGCNNAYIVTHKQTPEMMKEKHRNLLQTGRLCSKERHVRFSYMYNWDVPPTQCCIRDDPKVS